MELGLSVALAPREPVDRLVSLTRRAEDLGVNVLWMLDSQLVYRETYVTLAVLARETRTVRLGPGVTNLITRHETVVGNAMSTLSTFAPGRILVGLGAGDSSVFPLGLRPLSVERCGEALVRLRALLHGEAVGGAAGEIRLPFVGDPVPPVYLAASQPRMLRLAGAVADGVIIVGPADPTIVRLQMQHVDRGATQVGRDPKEVVRDLWVAISIGDEPGVVEDVKSYTSTLARWFSVWTSLPSSLERFRPEIERVTKTYDFRSHLRLQAEHAQGISDEFALACAVAGPLDRCLQRLRGLAEAGPDRLSLTLFPGGRERRLEQISTLWAALAPPGSSAGPSVSG